MARRNRRMTKAEQRRYATGILIVVLIVLAYLIYTSGLFWWGLLAGLVTTGVLWIVKEKVEAEWAQWDWKLPVVAGLVATLILWLVGLVNVFQGWIENS